jgi:hypothetical protein
MALEGWRVCRWSARSSKARPSAPWHSYTHPGERKVGTDGKCGCASTTQLKQPIVHEKLARGDNDEAHCGG